VKTFSHIQTARTRLASWLCAALLLAAAGAVADDLDVGRDLVHLDFQNAEITAVIDTIAKMTGTNFIYDDRVRGRVTIVSPTPMAKEQAYAVFESVLQVKGFTTVRTPGGALKVIPLRDAKETNLETSRSTLPPRNRDTFITRLIPLRYIDSESIVNTLKPLISKEAAIASYAPTNTVILTESSSNIRRVIAILESIDIETYREELTVIRVEYADAATMASQIADIFGAEVSSAAATSRRRTSRRSSAKATPTPTARPAGDLGKVRIITDDRTNSLIVLAPRTQIEEVRRLIRKLDVPVTGGGRIHVYYLQHADAEDLAQTLSSMLSGSSGGPRGGEGGAQAIRAAVVGLTEGISVTADPATNALVIQASKEGFSTLRAVIEQLDVARPQVLVEALIMEVDISDAEALGFDGLVRLVGDNYDLTIAQNSGGSTLNSGAAAAAAATGGASVALPFLMNFFSSTADFDEDGNPTSSGTVINGIIQAANRDAGTNILSAPHILTSDNEEAEIRVGDNIPIISSRIQSAAGSDTDTANLATSVNVERQDIGVTLRVTPQITEGDTLRMEIYQEITSLNEAIQEDVGVVEDVGPALSNRRIENTVVVADGETIVIGGLIGEKYEDTINKVPWFGDIPFLGWAFKSTKRSLVKTNLLVFLTPHIIRSKEDLEYQTIRKRDEFVSRAQRALELSEREQAYERAEMKAALEAGEPYEPGRGLNPVRHAILDHESRYPLERAGEIEATQRAALERAAAEPAGPSYFVQAGLYGDEGQAVEVLTELIDLGFDGNLLSGERGGALLYEVRVGPYETLGEASSAETVLERSQGLTPAILIEKAAE